MRFLERFLILLALIGLLLRFWGVKDGPTLELIAFPLLALFYLVATPFILHVPRPADINRASWLQISGAILAGGVLAYCIISCMLYTLGWLPRMDMLENCSILLGLIIVAGIAGWRRRAGPAYVRIGIRAAILLGAILIISLLPLPHIGSLSHGAF